MDAPRYSIIVPVRHFRADEPVLVGLREISPPHPAQILVAEGEHPARQRNAALALAKGAIIVFLDNDCRPGADFWSALETAFARPEVEIAGGPARLQPEAAGWEKIFHALLTHPLIVGSIAARYTPLGSFRRSTQTDLILCNLAVRAAVFEKIGPLSTNLYPNEENEWLDRAQSAGVGIYYDPALQVFRPQRATPGEMALMLIRYGMGRTRQFMVSGWKPTFHQFLPTMVLGTFAVIVWQRLEVDFVSLWLLASVIIAMTCTDALTMGERIMAGLIGPLLPLTYSLGQIVGWFALLRPAPITISTVQVLDGQGVPISSLSRA